jgi:8-amino-7-oxononanoate synthase
MNKDKKSKKLVGQILSIRKNYSMPSFTVEEATSSIHKYKNLKKLPCYKEMEFAKNFCRNNDIIHPFYKEYDGIGNSYITYNNKKYLNFSSYNYLNLNGNTEILDEVTKAVKEYGTSVSGSRLVAGDRPIHHKLEEKLATLYNADKSLLFVSGHATNIAIISTIFTEKDLILYDELSHNSIFTGIKLSSAKAFPFKHNDCRHLASLLEKYRQKYKKILIVTEGLFSMDGDIPDLPELVIIKNKYNAFLMIDEAHSTGVLGETGKGIFEYYGIDPKKVDIWMGTLSKTLCSCGGYIAGSSELIEILKYNAAGYVYSVGITPMNASAALASLNLMLKNNDKVKALQNISQYFLNGLKKNKLNIGTCDGFAVIPVILGSSKKAVIISDKLLKKYNISVAPAIYPGVEENMARLRFFLNSSHTKEQIDYTVQALVVEANRK